MNAILALEDGTWYQGVAAGATGETSGEVVFNTSMTGYQEVLTDPSYAGQIVTMTAPQIGNYGVAQGDAESESPRVAGFVTIINFREPFAIQIIGLGQQTGCLTLVVERLDGREPVVCARIEGCRQ